MNAKSDKKVAKMIGELRAELISTQDQSAASLEATLPTLELMGVWLKHSDTIRDASDRAGEIKGFKVQLRTKYVTRNVHGKESK